MLLLMLGGVMVCVWGAILWLSFFDQKQVGLIGRSVQREQQTVHEIGC